MDKIGTIDRNLAVKDSLEGENFCFWDVRQPPFKVYGLLPGGVGEPFCRIPPQTAQQVSERVAALNRRTAGGRVRFKTNSARIAIRAQMPEKCLMPHMTFLGSSGFDLYVTKGEQSSCAGSFMPPIGRADGYESMLDFSCRALRDITINFPLYDAVARLEVGLEPGASLLPAPGYRDDRPVLFYGSSITQGGCASRPGNSCEAVISRMLNCDCRNLGWSGSACGEMAMAEYIAAQPMCLFLMDYDHNSPSPEHLARTHEPFFCKIRQQNPELPIILASRTDLPLSPEKAQETRLRRAIVRATYENALRRGDAHVRFIDGGEVFGALQAQGLAPDSCTVDGCHPNDLGFLCMARVFGRAIGEMLGWL